ncbi:MAG: peptide-methionine (R)-S-oxide reductase MsrB [Synergistaceae bacterium]|nr:peptide-methionine (R)-S-oxide reductase MsrB [Synergistaceae bacterium]
MKTSIQIMILSAVITMAIFQPLAGTDADAAAKTAEAYKAAKEGARMQISFKDDTYITKKGTGVIYLAGGCFWGLEKLMQTVPGVVRATNGYANGVSSIKPTYREVSGGRTGYRETVRVEYRQDKVSLDAILFAFFAAIDPTVQNRQGNDIGSQYQTGVYFTDENSGKIIDHIVTIEKKRYENFAVEIKPLESFYDAEEYHQDYLDKNPGGYCHITPAEILQVEKMIVDPAKYRRPNDEEIKKMLSKEAYSVTVESGTEPPFNNRFWDHREKGLYVDVISGEPLFSSKDKFESPCGWPAFSKPIDPNTVVYLQDSSFGMRRTEVRSRTANSHLGHVFHGEPTSPNGTRFCINSLSLRFIPFSEMDKKGYGYLKQYVE